MKAALLHTVNRIHADPDYKYMFFRPSCRAIAHVQPHMTSAIRRGMNDCHKNRMIIQQRRLKSTFTSLFCAGRARDSLQVLFAAVLKNARAARRWFVVSSPWATDQGLHRPLRHWCRQHTFPTVFVIARSQITTPSFSSASQACSNAGALPTRCCRCHQSLCVIEYIVPDFKIRFGDKLFLEVNIFKATRCSR